MVIDFWVSNQQRPFGYTHYFVLVEDGVGEELRKNIQNIFWKITDTQWHDIMSYIKKEIIKFNGKFLAPKNFPKLEKKTEK